VLALLAGLVSLACIVGSIRRLSQAVSPTAFDAGLLLGALKSGSDLSALREGLALVACWERDLLEAASDSNPAARGPLLAEQVIEADWATERWIRAPRVGASVATSAGFLCACVILIQALGDSASGASEAAGVTLTPALDALALGIVGTTFCVAVHLRARAITRERRAAVDRLLDRVRMLSIS
jgi:hypothetical protein